MFRKLVSFVRELRVRFQTHHTLITVEISESRLAHNMRALRAMVPSWGIVPVLKSNAYGHGLITIARLLEKDKTIPFLAVDSYFEARALRAEGIRTPLLVLGYTFSDIVCANRLRDVSFVVASLEQLAELSARRARATIHIKIDTGMHRRGIDYRIVEKIESELKKNTTYTVNGIMSHLADAERVDSELTRIQIERWNAIARRFQEQFPSIQYYHLANSAGFAYAKDIVANVGRSGIALYGINPGNLGIELQPVLRLVSSVVEVREIKAGESVGYNAAFTATETRRIGLVPAGYYEGVDRRLSNTGIVEVEGRTAPIVGKVSMNMCSIDITGLNVEVGAPAVVISDVPGAKNSVQELSRSCSTIPYELLVRIPPHIRRIVV